MNSDEIKALDDQYVLHTYARAPFVLERGEGVRLYDTEGKSYLDFVSGIAVNALGYGDPDVLRAIREQSEQLMHVSNLYYTAPQAQLAQMLVQCSFADKVYFCNSAPNPWRRRSNSPEVGQRGFRPRQVDLVTLAMAFTPHYGALSVTPRPHYQDPSCRWCRHQAGTFNDLASAEALIDDQTCAVIVDPSRARAASTPPPPNSCRGCAPCATAIMPAHL
jgi:acetylornithine/N-succinyldiaminopimelate aminotransferase